MSVETRITFCRICEATCGLEVDVEDNRIAAIRPDPKHVVSQGYACVKGTRWAATQHSPDRVLHPQKRVGDRFVEIGWEQAIAEIGAKLRLLIDRHGPSVLAHFVGSAGDFSARGWSVSVSRPVVNGVRASVDYTQSTADWYGAAPDADALAILAPQALRANERIHDVTATVDSVVAASATRVCVVYKMNSAFTNPGDNFSASLANARFNVQVNQALPFLNFANANWEMLAAISNLFTADAVDGSVYDEALVTQPPKRILGGVTVRF